MIGKYLISNKRIARMTKKAKQSEQNEFAGDWVWTIKKGTGQPHCIELDYTECGIQKFMRLQKADELTPYFCQLDYMMFDKFGLKLTRTKTLAKGCECCNFRIRK